MAEATQATDWRASLPEELRSAPALKDVKDVGSLARSYLDAQTMVGNSVRIPTKEAGDVDRKAFRSRMLEIGKDYGVIAVPNEGDDEAPFYAALGAPADAKEYEVPDLKTDTGLEFDATEAETFREIAKASGLTKKQFQKVVAGMAKAREPGALAARAAYNEGHTQLKREWGDAYDKKMGEIGTLLIAHGAPEALREAVNKKNIDSLNAKWLHAILSGYGAEGSEIAKQGKKGDTGILSPSEALQRLDEIEKRLSLMNPGDTGYKELVDRRVQLVASAYK